MAVATQNFCPNQNYVVAASTSGVNQAITQPSGSTGAGGQTDIQIYNAASSVAYISWGMSNQAGVVSNANAVVAPGAIQIYNMGIPATNVGVLLVNGTGNVYISVGGGS